MLNLFAPKGPTIDTEITRLLTEMKEMPVESKEYATAIENLSWLTEARAQKGPNQVDMNTVITVTAALFEILLVMNHEKLNVITTKVFSRITRPRV